MVVDSEKKIKTTSYISYYRVSDLVGHGDYQRFVGILVEIS